MFSKHVGAKDSNEVERKAILEVLCIISCSFQHTLIVGSDSSNTFSWMKIEKGPWK